MRPEAEVLQAFAPSEEITVFATMAFRQPDTRLTARLVESVTSRVEEFDGAGGFENAATLKAPRILFAVRREYTAPDVLTGAEGRGERECRIGRYSSARESTG